MTPWIDWNWLALEAPWFGAALLLLAGLVGADAVWTRWQPAPEHETGGLPALLRWGPALAIGCGCAALFWLATPQWEFGIRGGATLATLLAGAGLCAFGLGRAGDHKVRLMVEALFWKQHAETVGMRLRHLLRKDQMLGYAAKSILTELEATSLRLFLLDKHQFQLIASLPSAPSHPACFEREGLLAQALCTAQRAPFLELSNPATGGPGNWVKNLKAVDPAELEDELASLRSFEAQVGVGLWRESKLAGFFLIGGRLTSDPFSTAQMFFTAEVASEVARMLDVLEAVEKADRIRQDAEEIRKAPELATQVRKPIPPPDQPPTPSVEPEAAVEKAELVPLDSEETPKVHEPAPQVLETMTPPDPAPVASMEPEAALEKTEPVPLNSEEVRKVDELATQVRKRMTPPDLVSVVGLEYGVAVEIAEGSQGSFCDVVALSGGALGIVMAECESSGVRIAVEMVRLQALLRSRLYVCGEDLRQALDSVEKVLLDSEEATQPVRLLLARYNSVSRRLLYVNAGYAPATLLIHNPAGPQTLRLTTTGRPLNSEGRPDWEVHEFELQRRDLLLAVSPGLMSVPGGEARWSEHRLLGTMLEIENQATPAIARRLVREAAASSERQQPMTELSAIALRPSEAIRRMRFMTSRDSTWGDYLRRT